MLTLYLATPRLRHIARILRTALSALLPQRSVSLAPPTKPIMPPRSIQACMWVRLLKVLNLSKTALQNGRPHPLSRTHLRSRHSDGVSTLQRRPTPFMILRPRYAIAVYPLMPSHGAMVQQSASKSEPEVTNEQLKTDDDVSLLE